MLYDGKNAFYNDRFDEMMIFDVILGTWLTYNFKKILIINKSTFNKLLCMDLLLTWIRNIFTILYLT